MIFLITILAALSPLPAQDGVEQKISRHLDAIRHNPDKLRIFFKSMPKGGDIHHHLSGSVWAEEIVELALKHQLCTDANWFLTLPPCAEGTEPFSQKHPSQFGAAVKAWSMHGQNPGTQQALDHFFSIFPRIGYAATRSAEVLPSLMERAALERVSYLETMTRAREAREDLFRLEARTKWRDDWVAFTAHLLQDPLFQEICRKAVDAFNNYQAAIEPTRVRTGVEVRYIYQIHRHSKQSMVFLSTAAAFEIARRSPWVVGVTMVGPETHYFSRTHYQTHMKILSFFRKLYPEIKLSLHAGETRPGMMTPENRALHLPDAINTAKAERIGHGADVAEASNPRALMQKMTREKRVIEIALSSNQWLLGLTEPHPMKLYWEQGVPMVLATDDAGIFRTDLTEQFVLAAQRFPYLAYPHFKEMARNSLEYAFLEGESLWAQRGSYTQIKPKENMEAFLATSVKARLQWRLETDLRTFEAGF